MSYKYKCRNMFYVSRCMIHLIVVRRKDISIINKLDNFLLVRKIKLCCSILVYKSLDTYLIRTPCAWFFEDTIDFSWIRSLFEIRSRILTTTKKTAQNRHMSVFIAQISIFPSHDLIVPSLVFIGWKSQRKTKATRSR